MNTKMTVTNSAAIFTHQRVAKVLAVSNFYHLPRVKLAFERSFATQRIGTQVPPFPWRKRR
jgi:uncharacterized SAM-binding protein YcdF (DUF218 family)